MFQWAATYVSAFAKTFEEFPQRQAPASWNVDGIMRRALEKGRASKEAMGQQ